MVQTGRPISSRVKETVVWLCRLSIKWFSIDFVPSLILGLRKELNKAWRYLSAWALETVDWGLVLDSQPRRRGIYRGFFFLFHVLQDLLNWNYLLKQILVISPSSRFSIFRLIRDPYFGSRHHECGPFEIFLHSFGEKWHAGNQLLVFPRWLLEWCRAFCSSKTKVREPSSSIIVRHQQFHSGTNNNLNSMKEIIFKRLYKSSSTW